jgi:hypothetical protein
MRTIFILLCLLPLGVTGQDLSKYLEGAVPEVGNRVVFTRSVPAPGLSREVMFERVAAMARERFKSASEENGKVLYSEPGEGVTICWGQEYLVFTRKALVLDRAQVSYQVTYTCKPGACDMEVTRLRYLYGEDKKTHYLAEEWITDEHALDKKRNRLLRGNDKFRIKTIDLVDDLARLLRDTLRATAPAATLPPPPATREGDHSISLAEITGNLFNILANGTLALSAPGDGRHEIITRWAGAGYLFNRPVTYCLVAPAGEATPWPESYTLRWRPAVPGEGPYEEILFECRALLVQPLTPATLASEALKAEWSDKPLPTLLAGEILSIRVK